MASVNKVILIGNCGRDPEVRYTPSGTAICNISVATSSRRKDKASGETAGEEITPPRRSPPAFGDENCVSSVGGAGAPRGRVAIQRSACSSAGERSNKPPGRLAVDQRSASSPKSVCCLIQPMSVCSALGKPIGAGLEAVRVIEKNEIKPPQRPGHGAVIDAPAHDRRNALVQRDGMRDLLGIDFRGDRLRGTSSWAPTMLSEQM